MYWNPHNEGTGVQVPPCLQNIRLYVVQINYILYFATTALQDDTAKPLARFFH